jgi:pimeloyl-ACP methyl ester carboxylesterase
MPPDAPADAFTTLDATAERVDTTHAGARLAWRRWGAGPPLVLLHGASGSWAHWVRNIPALAARFTVLAADMPGFGDSDLPPGPPSAEALAEPIARGIDELAPPPAGLDLAGFSMGAIIAGMVAARLGARVRRLVMLGPGGMALPPQPLPVLRRLEPGMGEGAVREVHRDNLRRLMLGDPAAADDLAVRIQMHNLARARFRSAGIPEGDALLRALPDIRARIAGLWGERDAFMTPGLDERRRVLARFQPDFEFRVIPGAGHWAIYEAAPTVDAIILGFLSPSPPPGERAG